MFILNNILSFDKNIECKILSIFGDLIRHYHLHCIFIKLTISICRQHFGIKVDSFNKYWKHTFVYSLIPILFQNGRYATSIAQNISVITLLGHRTPKIYEQLSHYNMVGRSYFSDTI